MYSVRVYETQEKGKQIMTTTILNETSTCVYVKKETKKKEESNSNTEMKTEKKIKIQLMYSDAEYNGKYIIWRMDFLFSLFILV